MNERMEQRELKERLSLVEALIAEGRQTTERWGWTFVLWGVAYYLAIAWATWGHSNVAWPVTMIVASLLTAFLASGKINREPETTIGRAISSIWIAMSISLLLFLLSASLAGRAEQHIFVAVIATMLATANATSSLILKWKAQFLCALVWWAAAVVSCFGTITQSSIAFLIAIFFGQMVFGIYMMISEARKHKVSQTNSRRGHA